MLTLKRMGARYRFLSDEINETDAELARIVSTHAPEILDVQGVGTVVASQLLVTFGDNPERMSSEAAFASLAGVRRSPRRPEKRTVTGSPVAVTGRRTLPCTASC